MANFVRLWFGYRVVVKISSQTCVPPKKSENLPRGYSNIKGIVDNKELDIGKLLRSKHFGPSLTSQAILAYLLAAAILQLYSEFVVTATSLQILF